MKCPNCGAEIKSDEKYCEYCGSQITKEMQTEQEQLNKNGCPSCGSSNITFKRENIGEVRSKKSKQVVHRTVGVCKDCGNTWVVSQDAPKSSAPTWLWVVGWLLMFPVPLTILMLRNKSLNKVLKIAIIVIAWIVYIAWIGGSKAKENEATTLPPASTPIVASEAKAEDNSEIAPSSDDAITLSWNEAGEYGIEKTINANTDMAYTFYEFHLPAGTYAITNTSDNSCQISILSNEYTVDSNGNEAFVDGSVKPVVLMGKESGEITVGENEFVKLSDNSEGITFVLQK